MFIVLWVVIAPPDFFAELFSKLQFNNSFKYALEYNAPPDFAQLFVKEQFSKLFE